MQIRGAGDCVEAEGLMKDQILMPGDEIRVWLELANPVHDDWLMRKADKVEQRNTPNFLEIQARYRARYGINDEGEAAHAGARWTVARRDLDIEV